MTALETQADVLPGRLRSDVRFDNGFHWLVVHEAAFPPYLPLHHRCDHYGRSYRLFHYGCRLGRDWYQA